MKNNFKKVYYEKDYDDKKQIIIGNKKNDDYKELNLKTKIKPKNYIDNIQNDKNFNCVIS